MHALTYRDDARDRKGLVAILKEIAKHKRIRFSGDDEDLSSQHRRLSANVSDMDNRNLGKSPTAWKTYKVLYDELQKLDPQVKQIEEDAKSIGEVLSGFGYEKMMIFNEKNSATLYVRHRQHTIDVLIDRDPYTRRWKLGYHQVSRENFPEWYDKVIDENNTLYRRTMDRLYRIRKSLGDSLIGMPVSAAFSCIPAAALTLMGAPMLGQGVMFAIMGLGGLGTAAESYHRTQIEPKTTFDRTCVVKGKKALIHAIDDTYK